MNALVVRLRSRADDRGFTLVEMLVAMVLMGILGSVFIAVMTGAKSSATATRSSQDLNEEARLGMNRMARELRQATALTSVLNPDGPSYSTSNITAGTFKADFNGDGCSNGVMPSPAPTPTPTCVADDPMVIALTASANGAHVQNYTTQVDLRNLS